MTETIRVEETVWIPMPDGTRLAARIWRPAGDTPVPALLEYIPYRRRDGTRIRDETMHPRFAEAGYASIRVDIRGSGDSEGTLKGEYLETEIQDGCDVIAWIADQPWCDGKVGMFGKSWGAFNALQVAARQPPALKAILPVMGTDDRYAEDIHFAGGVLTNDNFWWGAIMQLQNALPPDPDTVGHDAWRALWKERLDAMTLWPAEWLQHQTRDAFWQHGSVCEDYDAIKVPVFYIGGWADHYRDTAFRLAENLKGPCKVLMGPWAHLYPHEGAPGPQVDFIGEALRWWDHWLKGAPNGVMDGPRLRFFVEDSAPPDPDPQDRSGRWVSCQDWPAADVTRRTLWLNTDALGTKPDIEAPTLSICSPQTYGASGGDLCSFAMAGDRPGDCRADEGGALTFRTLPLLSQTDILGCSELRLRLSADRGQAFVAAVLADEAPDGTQTVITRGFLNLCQADGHDSYKPVEPGALMEAKLKLKAVGYSIPELHRLVLHVSSTYWPICWPSPDPVTLSLAPGQSALVLPIYTGSDGDAPQTPAPPPPAHPKAVTTVRPGLLERGHATDATSGLVAHRVFIDGGVFGPAGDIRLEETGTVLGSTSERIYSIGNDPLSARATMDQDAKLERGNWSVRIRTFTEMTASKEAFHLTATVECWDGDDLFHTSDWTHDIPRRGM